MQIQVKNLQNNRKRLFELIENNSFVVVHSGASPFKSADSSYNFFVNRNFYYLTGIDQEDVTLVIGKINKEYKEFLFIDENDPVLVKWVGAKLYKNEASLVSGIDERSILYNNQFDNFMSNYFQSLRYSEGTIENLYLDLERHNQMFYDTFGLSYAKKVKELYPTKTVWVYTGFLWEDFIDHPKMKYIDVLIDGRFIKSLRDEKLCWVGSSNQRIIDVQKTLEKGEIVLHYDNNHPN